MANGTSTFLVGVALGAVAGAAIALLYAPTSGEEARRQLRGSANQLSRRARRLYQGASDAAADIAAGGADFVDHLKDASSRLRAARS